MVDMGDNRDVAQALLAAHYKSTVQGRAASEYPKGKVFSSILIYRQFMTNELMPAEGYLATPESPANVQVVPIRIDGSLYGIPVAQAGDMVVLSAVVPVALAPRSVRGVLNRQGRMATVIETRFALGLPARASKAPLIGLTVEEGGHLYILAVDEVREIVDPAHAREPIAPLDVGAIVGAG